MAHNASHTRRSSHRGASRSPSRFTSLSGALLHGDDDHWYTWQSLPLCILNWFPPHRSPIRERNNWLYADVDRVFINPEACCSILLSEVYMGRRRYKWISVDGVVTVLLSFSSIRRWRNVPVSPCIFVSKLVVVSSIQSDAMKVKWIIKHFYRISREFFYNWNFSFGFFIRPMFSSGIHSIFLLLADYWRRSVVLPTLRN